MFYTDNQKLITSNLVSSTGVKYNAVLNAL